MNRVRYGYAAAASIMDYYEYNVRICLALLYPPQALVAAMALVVEVNHGMEGVLAVANVAETVLPHFFPPPTHASRGVHVGTAVICVIVCCILACILVSCSFFSFCVCCMCVLKLLETALLIPSRCVLYSCDKGPPPFVGCVGEGDRRCRGERAGICKASIPRNAPSLSTVGIVPVPMAARVWMRKAARGARALTSQLSKTR